MLVELLKSDDTALLKSDNTPLLHKITGNIQASIIENIGAQMVDGSTAKMEANLIVDKLSLDEYSLSSLTQVLISELNTFDDQTSANTRMFGSLINNTDIVELSSAIASFVKSTELSNIELFSSFSRNVKAQAISQALITFFDNYNVKASELASVESIENFLDIWAALLIIARPNDELVLNSIFDAEIVFKDDVLVINSEFLVKYTQYVILSSDLSILHTFNGALQAYGSSIQNVNQSSSFTGIKRTTLEVPNNSILSDSSQLLIRASGAFPSNSILQDVFSLDSNRIALLVEDAQFLSNFTKLFSAYTNLVSNINVRAFFIAALNTETTAIWIGNQTEYATLFSNVLNATSNTLSQFELSESVIGTFRLKSSIQEILQQSFSLLVDKASYGSGVEQTNYVSTFNVFSNVNQIGIISVSFLITFNLLVTSTKKTNYSEFTALFDNFTVDASLDADNVSNNLLNAIFSSLLLEYGAGEVRSAIITRSNEYATFNIIGSRD